MNKNTFNFELKIHNLFTNKGRFVHNCRGARGPRSRDAPIRHLSNIERFFINNLFTNCLQIEIP